MLATPETALAGLLRGELAFVAFTVFAAAGLAVLLRGFLTTVDLAAVFFAAGFTVFFAGDSAAVSAAASAACAAALAFSCAVT